jgi:hypothetical protein
VSAWETCESPDGVVPLRSRFCRAVSVFLLAAEAVSCISLVTHSSAAQTANIVGSYVHVRGVAAEMEVERQADQYAVVLRGGSRAGAGAASPADCYVQAVGQLEQDVLKAQFVAVETETFLYTGARAAREKRTLQISFTPGAAEVTYADTDGYCGLGATFLGTYNRAPGKARPLGGKAGRP